MTRALRAAADAQAGQVTLAVDERNLPARRLYTGLGFESFDERDVYLAVFR
jgi:ribosomal protein S18 acetylase RimI-like enzyme